MISFKAVAWVSIVLTILLSFVGMIVESETESASTLANSLDSFIDIFTSILLLWRFWGGEGDEILMEKREERAQIMIGFSFAILFVVVLGTALKHLEDKEKVVRESLVLSLAVPSFIIQLGLGWSKLVVAKKLRSEALKNDGISSILGSCLSGGIILDTIAMKINPRIWYFDAVFAIIVAIVLLLVALQVLVKLPWWRPSFWISPKIPLYNESSFTLFDNVLDSDNDSFTTNEDDPDLQLA